MPYGAFALFGLLLYGVFALWCFCLIGLLLYGAFALWGFCTMCFFSLQYIGAYQHRIQICILFVVCAADDIARVDYNDVITPFAVTITDATGGSAVDGTDILFGSPSAGVTVRMIWI